MHTVVSTGVAYAECLASSSTQARTPEARTLDGPDGSNEDMYPLHSESAAADEAVRFRYSSTADRLCKFRNFDLQV
jgi:hypothetical protein